MIRLGLCCKFSKAPIRFRTTTATYLKKLAKMSSNPKALLNEVVLFNTESLKMAIQYCSKNQIGSFRIGSDFLPVFTHPDIEYTLESLSDKKLILENLEGCRCLAKQHNIRLTFHPSQFVVLNSPRQEVVNNAIKDLEYHSMLADILGADVINIHLGGAYNDKISAINRFEKNFKTLSRAIKKRLTLENDDKTYSPSEILSVCQNLNIPFVYDVHHHRCHPDNLSIEEASNMAWQTWDREPLFHISSPLNGWDNPKPNHHHDFINFQDFPECWKKLDNFTIEVEAKAKEEAIEKLLQELGPSHHFI